MGFSLRRLRWLKRFVLYAFPSRQNVPTLFGTQNPSPDVAKVDTRLWSRDSAGRGCSFFREAAKPWDFGCKSYWGFRSDDCVGSSALSCTRFLLVKMSQPYLERRTQVQTLRRLTRACGLGTVRDVVAPFFEKRRSRGTSDANPTAPFRKFPENLMRE